MRFDAERRKFAGVGIDWAERARDLGRKPTGEQHEFSQVDSRSSFWATFGQLCALAKIVPKMAPRRAEQQPLNDDTSICAHSSLAMCMLTHEHRWAGPLDFLRATTCRPLSKAARVTEGL